jgi:hypothetical protein
MFSPKALTKLFYEVIYCCSGIIIILPRMLWMFIGMPHWERD